MLQIVFNSIGDYLSMSILCAICVVAVFMFFGHLISDRGPPTSKLDSADIELLKKFDKILSAILLIVSKNSYSNLVLVLLLFAIVMFTTALNSIPAHNPVFRGDLYLIFLPAVTKILFSFFYIVYSVRITNKLRSMLYSTPVSKISIKTMSIQIFRITFVLCGLTYLKTICFGLCHYAIEFTPTSSQVRPFVLASMPLQPNQFQEAWMNTAILCFPLTFAAIAFLVVSLVFSVRYTLRAWQYAYQWNDFGQKLKDNQGPIWFIGSVCIAIVLT